MLTRWLTLYGYLVCAQNVVYLEISRCGMARACVGWDGRAEELSITILPLRNGLLWLLLLRGKIDHVAFSRPPVSGGGNNKCAEKLLYHLFKLVQKIGFDNSVSAKKLYTPCGVMEQSVFSTWLYDHSCTYTRSGLVLFLLGPESSVS